MGGGKRDGSDGSYGNYGKDGSGKAVPSEKADSQAPREAPTRQAPQDTSSPQATHNSHSSHATKSTHTTQPTPPTEPNQPTQPTPQERPLLPPRGDYRTLLSFQKAEVVYDITFRFCKKHLPRGDRTVDQMIQAARSGKKNILEGSKCGLTSKEMEIKLTNVARGSLEELLDDYLDYLRARDHPIWDKDSREAAFVRKLGRTTPQTFDLYREFVETRPPETVANIAVCLIHQTNYLIDHQLLRLEKDFIEQGGLRERMTHERLRYRNTRKK